MCWEYNLEDEILKTNGNYDNNNDNVHDNCDDSNNDNNNNDNNNEMIKILLECSKNSISKYILQVKSERFSFRRLYSYMSPAQISRFMGPTWGPTGSCRPHMGPMLAPWTLLSGCSLVGNKAVLPNVVHTQNYAHSLCLVAGYNELILFMNYHQTSNIRHNKSPNLDISCLILQLPLPNPLKPGVKSRMKM